jgi:predicted NBD/HSP70 family sugar kinase
MDKMDKKNVFLGLDLGGTKLLIGEVDTAGTVLRCKKYPSGHLDQQAALGLIQDSLDDYLASRGEGAEPLRAMGLAMIGRIDSRRGLWFQIDSQRTAEIPVCDTLSKKYGLPCYADNDVRGAARAELRFGRGRPPEDFIYLNIGTGIAAGIVSGGRLMRGGHCNSGEAGHTLVGVDAGIPVPCVCGRVNCVEAIASGSGLDRCARALKDRYPGTSLTFPPEGRVDAAELFQKAGADPLCAFLTDTAARAIANLIMNLVRVSDPEMVVLGGGLVSDGILFPRIGEYLDKYTMRFVTRGVALTGLDPAFAGLLGAAATAMEAPGAPPPHPCREAEGPPDLPSTARIF